MKLLNLIFHWIGAIAFIFEEFGKGYDGLEIPLCPESSHLVFLATSANGRKAIRGKVSLMTKEQRNQFHNEHKLVLDQYV
jgi:hypothetical protein